MSLKYHVSAVRVNQSRPIISKSNSEYDFNYNPALFSLTNGEDGMLVRCQLNNPNGGALPSALAFSKFKEPLTIQNLDSVEVTPIRAEDIVFEPINELDSYGCEDPRIVYDNWHNEYVMLYSAVQADPFISKLALATSSDPTDPNKWVRHGTLYNTWSKSGAIIIDNKKPHYFMIWGDSSLAFTASDDLRTFKTLNKSWLQTRSDKFDSVLVESGPPPIKLSDGNYLFVYNSAKHIEFNKIQYNVGYLILDGENPQNILQRSDVPILSPDMKWEKEGLVGNVVFVEGMKILVNKLGNDKFFIVYGAGDANIGGALVTVQYSTSQRNCINFNIFKTMKDLLMKPGSRLNIWSERP